MGEFAGTWQDENGVTIMVEAEGPLTLSYSNGESFQAIPLPIFPPTIAANINGEQLRGTLMGDRISWSDGSIWTRVS